MTQPSISICIPTWNRVNFLRETLRTIELQTFQDFEVIICDDFSDDGTYEYLTSLNWPQLRVLRNNKHSNFFGSLEHLFREAGGEFIAMQHDHDLYDRGYLTKMVSLMRSFPSAGLGCCGYRLLFANGDILEPESAEYHVFPPSGLLSGKEFIKILATRIDTPIPAMATVFRKEIVQQIGGYHGHWRLASDEDLYRRVSAVSDVVFCPERLVTVRVRPEDRKAVLGGMTFVLNIFAFRKDTTIHWVDENRLWKTKNAIRLEILKWRSVLKEVLIIWMRGEKEPIEYFLCDQELFSDTGGHPIGSSSGIKIVRLIFIMAKLTLFLGKSIGSMLPHHRKKAV